MRDRDRIGPGRNAGRVLRFGQRRRDNRQRRPRSRAIRKRVTKNHVLLETADPKAGQTLHLIRGDSHSQEIKTQVAEVLPCPADVLFIDGDHTYVGVRADYEDYRQFVKDGGHRVP